jgi:hypothetical protein
MPQRVPGLFIGPSECGGKGVFTEQKLEEGDLVEICPVIVLSEQDLKLIHQTGLHDYYFLWGEKQDQCAIALGYGSLYNHSFKPNARYLIDYEQETIDIYCIETILPGEEITVNYNGTPDDNSSLWFEAKPFKKSQMQGSSK